MKIFLDEKKYLDLNLHNWNTAVSDFELDALRELFSDYVAVIGELPVYDAKTGFYNMHNIIENDFVFNMAIKWFAFHFNLPIEAPLYMIKDVNTANVIQNTNAIISPNKASNKADNKDILKEVKRIDIGLTAIEEANNPKLAAQNAQKKAKVKLSKK